jgi:NADPH-dependent 2,4-dienoyl-CoA reductase/sulfur reductase-like enzyme
LSAGDQTLVVVGAGPAGVMAAIEGSRWGLNVTVVDEQARIGGQYYRTRADSPADGSPRHLTAAAQATEARVNTTVFDAPATGTLRTWSPDRGALDVPYDRLVLATGAYERAVALPGWTLPGVMTAGGMHALAKNQRVVPGRRVIVAGAGPFLLEAADALASRGCQVVVVDATRLRDALSGLPALARVPKLLVQAAGYFARLARRRVAIRYGELVTAIHGDDAVEEVTVARVDRHWRPIPGTARRLKVDAVCLGFGFVPHLDLAQLIGCNVEYHDEDAGFAVATDPFMRTTVAGVYAAGETIGIAGVGAARLTGRLAGLAAAFDAGLVPGAEFARQSARIRLQIGRYRRVAEWMRKTYRPRRGLWELAVDETMACRCEDVTIGDLRSALELTSPSPVDLKTLTRAGMGPCQGRICSPFIIEWLRSGQNFVVPPHHLPWSIRPPVRPVPLEAWLDHPRG